MIDDIKTELSKLPNEGLEEIISYCESLLDARELDEKE